MAFASDSKDIAQDLLQRIKNAFHENLPSVSWMDDDTKANAERKLDMMRSKIGYPDNWPDYDGFAIDSTHFFENILAGAKYSRDKNTAKASQPVDKTEWHMDPQTVNAYYSPTANEMVFPAAILQPPFFKNSYPAAVNFGGIGSVMGHELSHGFDDSGRRFNGDGALTQWWSQSSIDAFQTRYVCFTTMFDCMH
jgi:putative endopeptidase